MDLQRIVWEELTGGLADARLLVRVALRLVAACALGAAIGWQRQRANKPAGLRTHMLVTLGATVFVLAAGSAGMSLDAQARVIQGLAAGIGFLGAGTILKLNQERHIRGLTTAAGIWMTAAVGVAVGLGVLGLAGLATACTLLILTWVKWLERHGPLHAGAGRPMATTAAEPAVATDLPVATDAAAATAEDDDERA